MEGLGKESIRVIGVVLVRDEDLYIRTAIENILPACDEVLVFDHKSSDHTPEILEEIAKSEPKVRIDKIQTPAESHKAIEKYAGTPTWVFAVDGDEIYDPMRTAKFFDRLRLADYSEIFQIRGNVLHVESWEGSTYRGYLGPPSRAMNKLYNFSHLHSWTGCFERLHGGQQVFRQGYAADRRLALSDKFDFSDSPFRCLHLVFLTRSSRDKENKGVRLNIADGVSARFKERCLRRLKGWMGLPVHSPGKLKNYRLGECVQVVESSFALKKEI